MSHRGTYKPLLPLYSEDHFQDSVGNASASRYDWLALRLPHRPKFHARPVHPLVRVRLTANPPPSQTEHSISQLRTLIEQQVTTSNEIFKLTNTITNTKDSTTTNAQRLRGLVLTALNEVLILRLQADREEMSRQMIDHLLSRTKRAAAEAARREVDMLIEFASGKTTRKKTQEILERVSRLSKDEPETLFVSANMLATVRVVLRKAELLWGAVDE
ncbi:hypothetical protein NUW58_g9301 [Xylaria curta]|uniref:Uncharacterized protein n=1 Tax=Xylaria curta TaxID=42375 RepID=A0ACC1MZA2_9PEZI|nr:hypothetical protein NUW58_g9301 [Xylaria curta]